MNREKKEKILAAAAALLISALVIFLMYDYIRYGILHWIFTDAGEIFVFEGYFLKKINNVHISSSWELFALLMPYVLVIIVSEISILLLHIRKTFMVGAGVIIFNLANLLFLFISLFYIMGTIALGVNGNEMWQDYFLRLGLEPQEQYLSLFTGTALTFFYSTFATTRIRKLITELS